MCSDPNRLRLFNQDTMSGIFPGSRTQVYQRLRLQLTEDTRKSLNSFAWAILAWYREPDSCSLTFEQPGQVVMQNKGNASEGQPSGTLIRLLDPLHDDIHLRLQNELESKNLILHACGTCANWMKGAGKSVDGLSLGLCQQSSTMPYYQFNKQKVTLRSTDAILRQSCLALGCEHWREKEGKSNCEVAIDDGTDAIRSNMQVQTKYEDASTALAIGQEVRRSWRHFVDWLGTKLSRGQKDAPYTLDLAELLSTERSGVGAGTEQCFACQGRIANIGALVVDNPEEDKQTYSVWRCRACYTCYLNEWTDRWERLDNLETEERYYRISPVEAVAILSVTESVVGGDHPHRRHERTAERDWFAQFLANRQPLSHQIKYGR